MIKISRDSPWLDQREKVMKTAVLVCTVIYWLLYPRFDFLWSPIWNKGWYSVTRVNSVLVLLSFYI